MKTMSSASTSLMDDTTGAPDAAPDPAPDAPWSDEGTPLGHIQEALKRFNEDRDWGRYHSPRNLAMALVVEASELMELFLWSSDQGPQPPVEGRAPKVADEAADVLICLLNLCRARGIDLARATQDKLERNAVRYPVERARGRLEKAEELPAAAGQDQQPHQGRPGAEG